MKLICLFSHPRTGTNYLHSVLRQWPDMVAFGEIFHQNEAFGLRSSHVAALAGPAGQAFSGPADPALLAWARNNPATVIDTLAQVARNKGRRALYLKVFPGQWPLGLARDLPTIARIPGFTPVLLSRRLLDVYVSCRKAGQLGTYKSADTTDVQIQLSADAFRNWSNRSRAWFHEVKDLLDRACTPPLLASYEMDIDMPAQALSDHWAARLGLAGCTIDPSQALTRQDRTPSLEAKLAEHTVFASEARRLGVWDIGLGGFV